MENTSNPQLLTAQEVSRLLRIKPATLGLAQTILLVAALKSLAAGPTSK